MPFVGERGAGGIRLELAAVCDRSAIRRANSGGRGVSGAPIGKAIASPLNCGNVSIISFARNNPLIGLDQGKRSNGLRPKMSTLWRTQTGFDVVKSCSRERSLAPQPLESRYVG
jgi:hypothetical protein